MLRFILALVSMSLIFAFTACGAKSEQPEVRNTTTPNLTINKNTGKPVTPQETVVRLLELAELGGPHH